VQAFDRITRTTVLGAGLVAIVQGAMLGLGLFFIGVPNPIILGFVGAVLSFLPVVGVALIWVPVGIIELANGSVWGLIGMLITGGLILVVDYTLRPHFQQKNGNIHPLISLLGVLIGIQYFGIFGIVVGPLLLSYAVLTIEMFMEEYVQGRIVNK
jgi:predicted PurR-regulated permease PerM